MERSFRASTVWLDWERIKDAAAGWLHCSALGFDSTRCACESSRIDIWPNICRKDLRNAGVASSDLAEETE
jgi:hypothetical protein